MMATYDRMRKDEKQGNAVTPDGSGVLVTTNIFRITQRYVRVYVVHILTCRFKRHHGSLGDSVSSS